jgi:hypothetical protein
MKNIIKNIIKKIIKEDLQLNGNIVIRKITKDDLKQIIPRLGEVFNKTGLSSQQIWGMMQHSDFNKSVVATIDDKIAGFYFFSNEQIPETRNQIYYELKNLNGIEGVALGIFEEYKNLGIGKKLIEYTKSIPSVDYIWGYQLKSLKNIDDWLKRRKIYAENDYMYVTYQLFNKSLSENFKKKLIKEQVTKTKVICDNCGWSWKIKDGGDDPYVCHNILPSGRMCNHDNTPKKKIKEEENILNEKCWKGYTQKGMKTMFGKQYPNCVKKLKEQEEEDYRSSHKAPSKEETASLDNLTNNIYPADIYSNKALQYYGDGHPFDRLAIAIMQSARNKPNKPIKIYRAVPDFNYQINKKIKELLKINQYYDKFNFLPMNNNIIDNLKKYDYPIGKYSYDEQTKLILQDIANQINELKTKLQNTKLTINSGDWVTITPQYANLHGKAVLNNKYKILTKTVPAHTLYTDGNSIHEFGYNP